jgi:S-formylglutathione hydrolase FrmB
MRNILLTIFLLVQYVYSNAATVDTVEVHSNSMNKNYKAAVVLPASYSTNKQSYPVLYLLHGGAGHFSDWLIQAPNKMLVKNLADQYNIIIVLPEGEAFSWYMDSPFEPAVSKFETHIINEVIPKIDLSFRTVNNRNGRAITGLSMGGHGALYLSARHPDIFCAAGSMSGSMDMNFAHSKMPVANLKAVNERFEQLLGTSDPNSDLFVKNSVVNMTDMIKNGKLSLFIDCGVDDFLIGSNRELHQRLLANSIAHDYIERPGGHSWNYWQNALPYHVLFFDNVFKTNKVAIL